MHYDIFRSITRFHRFCCIRYTESTNSAYYSICKISSLINIRRRIELISSPLRTVSRVEAGPKAFSHYQLERYCSYAPPRLRWNFISAWSNAPRIAINPWINRDQRSIRLASWRRLRFFPARFFPASFRRISDDIPQNHVTSSSKFKRRCIEFDFIDYTRSTW